MKLCGIYRITNTVTGEIYIGQSVRIRKRWSEHRRLLRAGAHHSANLQRSWAQHAPDDFEFDVLAVVDEDQLDVREREFVERLKPALNMRTDHIYGAARGYHLSEETIAKLRGRKLTDAHRQNIARAQIGARRSAAARARISEGKQAGMAARREAGLPAMKPRTARRKDAKLSDADILAIRAAWIPGNQTRWKRVGPTIKELAAQYSVGYLVVWKVLRAPVLGVDKCA